MNLNQKARPDNNSKRKKQSKKPVASKNHSKNKNLFSCRGKSANISTIKKEQTFKQGNITSRENNDNINKIITQSHNELDNLNLLSLDLGHFSQNDLSSKIQMNNKKLLPDKAPEFVNKKTLIIDLDETLVHSGFTQYNPLIPSDLILNVELEKTMKEIHVLIRPGVEDFLNRMSKTFEIIIFTASLSKYANQLIDILDKKRVCQFRLFRENCTFINGAFIKDLKNINRNLKDVILLDNSPIAYAFHPENGFPIKNWYDDRGDRELYNLAPILEFLSYVNDVREYIPQLVVNHEVSFGKAMNIISEYNDNLKKEQLKLEKINNKSININIVNKNRNKYSFNDDKNEIKKTISTHSNTNEQSNSDKKQKSSQKVKKINEINNIKIINNSFRKPSRNVKTTRQNSTRRNSNEHQMKKENTNINIHNYNSNPLNTKKKLLIPKPGKPNNNINKNSKINIKKIEPITNKGTKKKRKNSKILTNGLDLNKRSKSAGRSNIILRQKYKRNEVKNHQRNLSYNILSGNKYFKRSQSLKNVTLNQNLKHKRYTSYDYMGQIKGIHTTRSKSFGHIQYYSNKGVESKPYFLL